MIKNEEIEKLKKDLIFKPLNSVDELQDWMYLYFDVYFPKGVVWHDSTHSPADAMWRIYQLIKTGENINVPEVVMRASRDSGKTLAAAALEVLCMLHFRISVCHMAAITSQSLKAIQYVELFLRKIKPYLIQHGWKQTSDNKRMIEWVDETGQNLYLKIIVATIAGANCLDPNTVVITKQGDKKIKEVNPEKDEVLTIDYRNGMEIFQPISYICQTRKPTMKIYLEDGSDIVCSTDHQIFTTRGWVTADQIKINEKLLKTKKSNIHKTEISSEEVLPKRDLLQVILGTVLGDASLTKTTGKRVRYKVAHCESQKEYIYEIARVFKEHNIDFKIYEYTKKNPGYENVEKTISLHTKTEDIFQEIYKYTYINGKKTVTKEWIDRLNIEGISYLIMDDGCVGSKDVGRGKESFLGIATCSFSTKENQLLIDKLKSFGVTSFLRKTSNGIKKYDKIVIKKDDSRNLSKMMEPFFVNCLRYKLRTPIEHVKFRRYIDTSEPFFLDNKSSGSGFSWKDKVSMRSFATRKYIKEIRSRLNTKVIKIERLGTRDLIDISIKTSDEHLKSFYANGVLVHNSEHVPLLFCDEIDVVQDPRALEEAKMIPSSFKDIQPLTIYLSTLKFSGGLMQKTMDSVKNAGGEIYSWNIIDITERIDPEVARANEPKVTRYITTQLPMSNISPQQFNELKEEEKVKYERFEAYAGIAEHPMLPVMRNYLVDRPEQDKGGLFKKLQQTHNLFKKLSIDMSDAQLLCNRPSSSNLVYPRFDSILNVLTISQAWEKVTGNKNPAITHEQLREFLLHMGASFIGGADWGYTDYTSLVVLAMLPGGSIWVVDSFLADKLELEDICKYALELDKKWNVDRWYVDQAYPAYIATLRRKGLKVPEFTKVVSDGIAAIQSRIVDSNGVRRFFVLDTPENKKIIETFDNYKWSIDGKGEIVEGKPHHDRDGYSDIADSIRYPMQNLFGKSNKVVFTSANSDKQIDKAKTIDEMATDRNKQIFHNKIEELVPEKTRIEEKSQKNNIKVKKKILFM
jgi:hypothetical protein